MFHKRLQVLHFLNSGKKFKKFRFQKTTCEFGLRTKKLLGIFLMPRNTCILAWKVLLEVARIFYGEN